MPRRARILSAASLALGAALLATACSGGSASDARPAGNDAGGYGDEGPIATEADAGTPSESGTGGDSGTAAGDAISEPAAQFRSDGGAPNGFCDSSNIPTAKNVMMFEFLNRTNGKYKDSEVYWSFKNGGIS